MENNFLLMLDGFGLRKRHQSIQGNVVSTKWIQSSIDELRKSSAEYWVYLFLWIDFHANTKAYKMRIIELDKITKFLSEQDKHYLFSQAVAISNCVTEEKIQKTIESTVEVAASMKLFEPMFRKVEDLDKYNDYTLFPKIFANSYFKSIFDFAANNLSYLSPGKPDFRSYPDARTDANYVAIEILDIPDVEDQTNCNVLVTLNIIPLDEAKDKEAHYQLYDPYEVTFRVITGNWLKAHLQENDLFFTQHTLIVNELSREVVQEHIDHCLAHLSTALCITDVLVNTATYFYVPDSVLRLLYKWDLYL